jgi:hypothetical protein
MRIYIGKRTKIVRFDDTWKGGLSDSAMPVFAPLQDPSFSIGIDKNLWLGGWFETRAAEGELRVRLIGRSSSPSLACVFDRLLRASHNLAVPQRRSNLQSQIKTSS